MQLGPLPSGLAVALSTDSAGWQRGMAEGDPTPRVLLQPRGDDDATMRLCGTLATRTLSTADLPWAWPVDTAQPRLAVQFLSAGDVQGVRFVVPGSDAHYRFEGFTRDGARRVSVRWPVVADPAHPVPVGAPDSVVEGALVPRVPVLDSLVRALRFATAPDTAWPVAVTERPFADARAVLDDRILPVHRATLSFACPDVTLALPMIARVDQTVKVDAEAGDIIAAHAGVSDGTVRIRFDEAPPADEPPGREAVPKAAIEATGSGPVTLRVSLQTVPKSQLNRQTVLVRLQRTRPAR